MEGGKIFAALSQRDGPVRTNVLHTADLLISSTQYALWIDP